MTKTPTKAAAAKKAPADDEAPAKVAKAAPKAAEHKKPASKDMDAKKIKPKAGDEVVAAKKGEGKTVARGTKVEEPKDGHKPNALQQPLQPSAELAAVVGEGKMARGEVVSKVWVYIKANKLQNPDDGREILADDKLKKVFGKPRVTMFEMNKFLAQHLK